MAENKGEITYEIRADDSQVEKDLDKANKKVEKAAGKSSDDVVKVEEKKTKKIKVESDKTVKSAEKAADNVADAWKDAGKDAEKAMSDIDVEDVSIAVEADTVDAKKNIEGLQGHDLKIGVEADTVEAKKNIDGLQTDDISIGVNANTGKAESAIKSISKDKSVDVEVKADNSKAESEIESLADTADDVGKKIEGSLTGALGNVAGLAKSSFVDAAGSTIPFMGNIGELTKGLSGASVAALGIGAAAVGTGVIAVKSADDMRGAMNQFMSETGKSREEMERYQGVLEDVYANNYGESFDDIASGMSEIRKQIGPVVDHWSDEALQGFTESAFTLRDTLGYDIPESVRAAKTMMDQFGVDGQYAFDLIAKGAQNGLDFSGEMLDSINEYSVQFSKMGMDADDMFKMLQKGAESGAFNLDKIGDAVKENAIRVIDYSATTSDAYSQLGLDIDDMSTKFASGGDSAKGAFDQVMTGLIALNDPVKQNIVGTELFGTMWEDLGPDVVMALGDIEDGAYATGEELNKMKEVKYDDLGSMFEELKRNVELLLLPLGESLMPLLMELIEAVLPIIKELLVPVIKLFGDLLAPILELVSGALAPLIDVLMELINAVLTPLILYLENVFLPIFTLVFEVIADVVTEHLGKIAKVIQNLTDFVKNVFTSDWSAAWENIKTIFSTVFGDGIFSLAEHIKGIFTNVIDFIKNVFTANWKGAWENIKGIFSNQVGALVDIFKMPINAIVDGWNSLSSRLGNMKIPKWVPFAGGNSFSLPTLPRLRVGMDYVPSDDFPALLHRGEAVLTAEENKKRKELGGYEGIEKMLSSAEENVSGMPSMDSALRTINVRVSGDTRQPLRVEVPVIMDGRETARAMADFMGEQLSWEEM